MHPDSATPACPIPKSILHDLHVLCAGRLGVLCAADLGVLYSAGLQVLHVLHGLHFAEPRVTAKEAAWPYDESTAVGHVTRMSEGRSVFGKLASNDSARKDHK